MGQRCAYHTTMGNHWDSLASRQARVDFFMLASVLHYASAIFGRLAPAL